MINDFAPVNIESAKPEEIRGMDVSTVILDSMPYPVVMLDELDTISFANFASEGFFRSSVTFLKGRNIGEFLPFGSAALDMLSRVRSRKAAIREYGVDLSSPRMGSSAIVDIVATPVGELTGNVVIIFQKRAMAEKIDRQLTHRGAARTVTGLASMLAHEIKNPLSGIRGAAQLLETSVEADDKSLTQLICKETDRIVKLVDRMEIFSDERLPERDPINIHSVLEHVRDLARTGFGAGITFLEEYDPSLPPVLANRDQLVQVFINIVKNACEAVEGKDDPQITFITAYRPGIKMSSPGNAEKISLPLEYSIADNGGGIAQNLAGHVFDPFVTTKANGTGLGLALVSKIVHDHGGVIEIVPENPGTRVRILMPAWKGDDASGYNSPATDGVS